MDVTATLTTAAPPSNVFAVVADLGTYPSWLDIVAAAAPVEASSETNGETKSEPEHPSWLVDLRAQLGPLRRTKRLTMRRTVLAHDHLVRFERREDDGRRHSEWVMEAEVLPAGTDTDLIVRLRYGGSLWLPALDRVLRDEITRSRHRLAELVETAASE